MSDIKRFNRREIYDVTYQAAGDECLPEPSENGEFVLYSDYAALRRAVIAVDGRNAALQARCEELNELVNNPYRLSQGWRPIETAPKGCDVWVLAFFETEHGEKMVDCASQWEDGSWTTTWDLKVNPTHWMPLPKPPTP